MSGFYLHADGLLSKWGFNDGDEPDGYLDWLEANHPDSIGPDGWPDVADWHDTLVHFVRTRLLPLIEADVEVETLDTIHNPIRAKSINGAPCESYYGPFGLLGDVSVEIPWVEVYDYQATRPAPTPTVSEWRLSGPALDRLPVGSVVLDYEDEAWQRVADGLWVSTSGAATRSLAWADEPPEHQEFRVLWVTVTTDGGE